MAKMNVLQKVKKDKLEINTERRMGIFIHGTIVRKHDVFFLKKNKIKVINRN